MPKAILHILGTAQPEGSGIARIVAALATGLNPDKYLVHAWFLGPPGPLIEELQAAGAIARSINWWRGVGDPIGAYRFWRCLQKYDFAVVHLHQHFATRSVRSLLSHFSNAHLVVHLHGRVSDPTFDNRILIGTRRTDATIAVSHAIALQAPSLRPVVVYTGVETAEEFRPGSKALSKATTIGAASRLVPLKGLAELIQAVASLHLEFPELQLEIAGAGPERKHLEREVDRLGLQDQVRFLGWQQNMRPVLQRWDIFAMPSLDEGLPIAVLEAMAESLPVVATSVGGLPELVEDCHTGYLVPPSDITALTRSLRFLIQDATLRQSMGAAGRKRVLEHFSVHGMVAKIESIYDSLLSKPTSPEHIEVIAPINRM